MIPDLASLALDVRESCGPGLTGLALGEAIVECCELPDDETFTRVLDGIAREYEALQ